MSPSTFKGHILNDHIKGSVKWSSPSNIALTKYWGKHGHQLPRNSSVSFTLSTAKTITQVSFESKEKPSSDINLSFEFEGQLNAAFAQRIIRFLEKNKEALPYIDAFEWHISSENTFPHSSGIASSASAMSCLIMALIDIERHYLGHELSNEEALQRASYLSRLASGSACRSVYPLAAEWGHNDDIKGSSDLFALPVGPQLHADFQTYHDDILIVSSHEKSVSSSAGHQLMEGNPFRDVRFSQANTNTARMMDILKGGDIENFIDIVEEEALTLHALMMTSRPSYVLMEPNSLAVINEIRDFRKKNNVPISFTLDAGPNVHILYPEAFAQICKSFINEQLIPLSTGMVISDQLGQGPVKLDI